MCLIFQDSYHVETQKISTNIRLPHQHGGDDDGGVGGGDLRTL